MLLHAGLYRRWLLGKAQYLHHVFLRCRHGAYVCQRKSDVFLQLCGDDRQHLAFYHEVGKSVRIGILESDGLVVHVAVSDEIGCADFLRFSVCDGLSEPNGVRDCVAFLLGFFCAHAHSLAPPHGLRSEGGIGHRGQRRTRDTNQRMDGQQTPSNTTGGGRGVESRNRLESGDKVVVSRDAVLSYRGDHRLLRMAKQHRRNPFSYWIRVQSGPSGYVALSDAESHDDAAERNVFLSVGGGSQHFLPVRHDL